MRSVGGSDSRVPKGLLIEVVCELYEHGLTSSTLLAEAVGVTQQRVSQILIAAGLRKHLTLQERLEGLPEGLRKKVELLRQIRAFKSKAKVCQPDSERA